MCPQTDNAGFRSLVKPYRLAAKTFAFLSRWVYDIQSSHHMQFMTPQSNTHTKNTAHSCSDDEIVFMAVIFTSQIGCWCYDYITGGCCHDCAAVLPVRRPGHQQARPRPRHHAGILSLPLLSFVALLLVLSRIFLGSCLYVHFFFSCLFLCVMSFLRLVHLAGMSFLQVCSPEQCFPDNTPINLPSNTPKSAPSNTSCNHPSIPLARPPTMFSVVFAAVLQLRQPANPKTCIVGLLSHVIP